MFPNGLATELELTPALGPPVAGQLAPSPYNFEFTAADALRLTVHNSQPGVVVAVHYRVLTEDRGIVSTVYRMVPATDRSADSEEFVIGEGYLLNVTVFASSGSPRRGQTFVRLQAIHGRGVAATVLGTLVQGYVTGNQDRAWPGSPLEGSLEGDGYIRTITGTDPGAGQNGSETVPTNVRWWPLAFAATLITDATVATRRPIVTYAAGGVVFATAPHPQTVIASSGAVFVWSVGMTLASGISTVYQAAGLPAQVRLLAGEAIEMYVENLTPGDNWTAPTYKVMEWLEAQ